MIISACSTKHGSVTLSFCCDLDKKTACFEVTAHILGGGYGKIKYADFPEAVDAYNSSIGELKAMEG